MSLTLARPNIISLAAGFTDNESLPVQATQALVNDILSSPATGKAALQYGTTAGDPELRRLTAQMLQTQDTGKVTNKPANAYSPDNVLITHGSQQLLYMVTEALCDEGDIVLLEDPSYFVYLGIAQSRGLKTRGIKLLEDGIDIDQLESILKELKRSGQLRRLKMLYLVTYFQNPSGITTSYAKKTAALELLRKYEKFAGHPIYMLEDAAYRDLRFSGEDIRSTLAANKDNDRVIYAGTYSKPFSSGARVGFGFLPEPVLGVVSRLKGNHDFGTANFLQQIVKGALASKAFDRHVADLKVRYACKAQVMRQALRAHFPETVQWMEPKGGLYFWARVPEKIKTGRKSKVFARALENNVLYVPGEFCYAEDETRPKPNHEMRISFGGATEESIRIGIERLGKVLKKI